MNKKFKVAVLGGTFDHLHRGHKNFITYALSLSEKLIIGVTSDYYVSQNKENIESFEIRKKSLEEFLKSQNLHNKCEIESIDDTYGIALSKNIDALFVVDKTIDGGNAVNIKRKELSLAPLELIVVFSEKSEDGEVISSSRIRKGEINREGKLFIDPKFYSKKLSLPNRLREELKKPWGNLISDNSLINLSSDIVTVGDVTTKKFNELNLNQKISVVDLKVDRENRFKDLSDLNFASNEYVIQVNNPSGEITPDLFRAVVDAFSRKENVVVQVLGEEDLAVLPLILAAPLGVSIFYGQPGSGLVKIFVDEDIKEKIYDLISNFD